MHLKASVNSRFEKGGVLNPTHWPFKYQSVVKFNQNYFNKNNKQLQSTLAYPKGEEAQKK